MIQGTFADTDQVHSRPVVTVRRPVPPDALTDGMELATVMEHRSGDGPVTVVEDVPQAIDRTASVRPINTRFIRFLNL